jgi:flagellar basal body rod protein FlgG
MGADGALLTSSGEQVQDIGGSPITLPNGVVEIRPDGTVLVNARPEGQVRLVEFEDPRMLRRDGYTLFAASDEALQQVRPPNGTTVIGGAVETSNVQIPIELTQMTMALRSYAANQRVVTAIDETLNRLIDQVGAPS